MLNEYILLASHELMLYLIGIDYQSQNLIMLVQQWSDCGVTIQSEVQYEIRGSYSHFSAVWLRNDVYVWIPIQYL